MSMQDKLVEILVCPACKGDLVEARWQGQQDGDDGSSPLLGLDCRPCRLRYPIVDDIPVMLVEQAQRIPS